jgi:hypothetical protein
LVWWAIDPFNKIVALITIIYVSDLCRMLKLNLNSLLVKLTELLCSINATTITIEVYVESGKSVYDCGFARQCRKESQQRITSALQYTGSKFPHKQL